LHPFGVDINERRNVLVVLVPISFWLSAGFTWIVTKAGIPLPDATDWIFDPLSAAACFAALYLWVEYRGWRSPLLRRSRLVQTPDLNGSWEGQLQSSYDDFKSVHQISVAIRQSWTRIVVELRTSQSTSHSDTASIFVEKGVNPVLVYTYLNSPNPDQQESMHRHAGTTLLELTSVSNSATLEGNYYSGRGRGTYGTMFLSRLEP
jgi:predicted pore-forming effector associated with SMODS systems